MSPRLPVSVAHVGLGSAPKVVLGDTRVEDEVTGIVEDVELMNDEIIEEEELRLAVVLEEEVGSNVLEPAEDVVPELEVAD